MKPENKLWLETHREPLLSGLKAGRIKGANIPGNITKIFQEEFPRLNRPLDEMDYDILAKAITDLFTAYDQWLAAQPATA